MHRGNELDARVRGVIAEGCKVDVVNQHYHTYYGSNYCTYYYTISSLVVIRKSVDLVYRGNELDADGRV